MESIGQQLASARRRKGLNLKEVEEATKIRLRFLEALEAEEFDVIPGAVYVKGFIRSYASYLKIDPQPLVEKYKQIQPQEQLSKVESVAPYVPTEQRSSLRGRRFTVPAALLTIIFLMTVFLAYLGYQDTIQSSKLSDRKYVNRELKELENKRKHKASKKKKKAAASDIFKLKLVILKSTWVKVSADSKTFFGQYLRTGRREFFISRKPLEITAGKGSDVKVYLNGKYKGTISDQPTIATKVYKK